MRKLGHTLFQEKCPSCGEAIKDNDFPVLVTNRGRVPAPCPYCGKRLMVKGLRYWAGSVSIILGPLVLLAKVTAHWSGLPQDLPYLPIVYVFMAVFVWAAFIPGRLRVA